MPKGNLVVRVGDVAGDPVSGRIDVELTRVSGEPGVGGETVGVTVSGSITDLTITGIPCRGGKGTMYKVFATASHFRPYSFFQLVQENRDNTASDDIEFWVRAGDVSDIQAPGFEALPAGVRAMFENAAMQSVKAEDRDLLGATGAALYRQLGPLRKACVLNIVAKMCHAETTGDCLEFVNALLLCRQDRFFVQVDGAFPEHLRQDTRFKSAPSTLHDALPGFQPAEGSFKSRDAHANLQVTFMRHAASGMLAADIDIDEASGIEHGFEVIRNALFRNRTNPYLIREFMISSDPVGRTLVPGYRFTF